MSFDLSWEHQFCLSCDRQTDGPAYCSESCRLSDFEKSSSSSPSSPTRQWPTRPNSKFYLAPAYDFSNARPYGSTPRTQRAHTQGSQTAGFVLTPSSSHSSLFSLQSTSSTGSDTLHLSDKSSDVHQLQQLSEKSKRQLRDYASSFEQARLQRRRSY